MYFQSKMKYRVQIDKYFSDPNRLEVTGKKQEKKHAFRFKTVRES